MPTNFVMLSDTDADTRIYLEKNTDEDRIRFDTAGTERMVIDNSGNVGIGTSSPAQKLSVVGMIESTLGGVRFPDGSTQTTAFTGSSNNLTTITSNTNATVNSAYLVSSGSQVAVTLPASCSVGQTVKLIGFGAGGWRLIANTGQSFHDSLGGQSQTAASIYSVGTRDTMEVTCVQANTAWMVTSETNRHSSLPTVGVNGASYSGGRVVLNGYGVLYYINTTAAFQDFTFNVPPGVSSLDVTVLGGGGANTSGGSGGGPGGGGARSVITVGAASYSLRVGGGMNTHWDSSTHGSTGNSTSTPSLTWFGNSTLLYATGGGGSGGAPGQGYNGNVHNSREDPLVPRE
ncbi:MAG: hypothetical protein K2Q26_08200 [Bdellovibrionales bacterium]|nr:hypothetical protein [Bdellovibrionales bacterium]